MKQTSEVADSPGARFTPAAATPGLNISLDTVGFRLQS